MSLLLPFAVAAESRTSGEMKKLLELVCVT
jgi:hypothetical protein